ncbi:MAG: ABC transporter ATP-binding protein [Rhodospirillales bacterium]|jgi:branched-chain amino acid transport system ATP-binding protein
MLELRGVSKAFGGLKAVDDVSFTVARGTITGLIGPNGAGKTTLFNTVAGALKPTGGEIRLDGRRIDGLPSHRVYRSGLARTFQIPRPIGTLSVLENVMLAPTGQTGERAWNALLRPGRVRAEERANREKAVGILEFLNLIRLADEPARTLSGGQLKLLELARALMSDPRVILLDEPGAGVNPTLLGQIVERIAALNRRGITFLIIEHNMDLVMNLCRPVVVMAGGRLLMEGDPEAVRGDPRVLDAYLGGTA